jgi:serine/threonine protein kinase
VSLTPGTRLGVYEIATQIGEGGMGQVFRATDTKLKRQVAIKILPAAVAADAERLARFQREAEVLASLNHPNIAAIYGLEENGGVTALVMELVEGEDLSQRIARGAIPFDEALPIMKQIADALEAAHEQGIIHRDLKPANIKVRPDGTVKVLDFGLAKAMEPAGTKSSSVSMSPTITTPPMTQAGMIVGTAAYMSPEQAKGHPADQRSDVFSFGCVLFEMLSGRQAFLADTAAETLAAVLMREPDLSTLPPNLSPRLREMVGRCLEKTARRRWQAVGDLRIELEAIATAPRHAPALAAPTAVPQPLWRRAAPILVATFVTAVVAGLAGWNLKPSSAKPGVVTRFPLILPDDFRFARTASRIVAVSPDGTLIAYNGNRQLYVRALAETEPRSIPGTIGLDPVSPFFSPDGQWIGFVSVPNATLNKIAVSGGAPLTLFKFGSSLAVADFQGPSWDGDQILFARQNKGVMRISANGGEPEVLVPVKDSEQAYGPQLLPGGKAILFTLATEAGPDRWDKAQVVAQSLTSGERKVLVRGGGAAQYVPTGHIVYVLGSTLLAIPFDLTTLEIRGGPLPVVEGVRRAVPVVDSGAAEFALSTAGSLVYIPGASSRISPQTLALVDRDGKVEPLGLPPQPYVHPRVSPDGKRMAYGTDDGTNAVVWIADLKAGAAPRRLTFGGRNLNPIWSRDGRYMVFQSDREGDRSLFRQPVDGTGTAERLTRADGTLEHRAEDWSPDDKTLLFTVGAGSGDLWTLSLDGDRKPKPIVQLPSNERYATFSPDGRYFAYTSNEVGNQSEVFVQPYPPTGAKYQVSTGGGRYPLWSPDARQLFYDTQLVAGGVGSLVAVEVRTQPALSFGKPTPIPVGRAVLGANGRYYDITPDGKQFLVVTSAGAGNGAAGQAPEQINVVLNWSEELKQRVPTR